MRILIIHQWLWAHYKAKIYSELQTIVNKNNDKLLVLQTSANELTRAKLGKADERIHQYDYKLLYDEYYENISNFRRFKAMFYWVRKFKPDVVNISGYYEPAMNLILLYCKLSGIKVVISIDSTESDNPNVGWREKVKSLVVNMGNGFFCYGSKSAEYMYKLGISPEKILLKNNAVDNQKVASIYQEAQKSREIKKNILGLRKYNFIYVGRLIKFKNIDNLLAAYKNLNTPDWGLIILGNGSEEEKLKHYVSENQLEGVCFVDGKQWFEVPEYMALADIFILPSFSEPWGLVVNEAMACGMPVLVSEKCGSAPDLVHENKNGFKFDPFDVVQMTEKMNEFVLKPEIIEPFGLKSKQIIQNFSPEKVAEEMWAGFKKVVTKGV
ncbi:MAG: glycosyltransferase family 4 protein [Bacteroidetes bacterium]|nr:glycosyltransferase family 4 protein [Bacteroidota bacterium]